MARLKLYHGRGLKLTLVWYRKGDTWIRLQPRWPFVQTKENYVAAKRKKV
jgi:hypothetical protein